MDKKQILSGKEIRKKFIKFFSEKHGHKHIKSSNLIPENPTVLLTTAGMLQFVPIFLGYENRPEPPRAVSVQKCVRAGGKDSDIENVGRTPRHHTFFEMLGNFSFGDYFKDEIIPWSWDFVNNYLNLDKSRLWITVFEKDDETLGIWRDKVGIPEERILKKGAKDNFWGPPGPTGPCGPCTEIHYDLGEEYACKADCSLEKCECDRYVEIWNLVFMELNKDEEGNFTPLEKKNVDTGMGLERITMVVNGLTSTFDTDLLSPILETICQMSGKTYKKNPKTDISLRIITDHARCVSFLITDGLTPGNEGRHYVLRMILRRALRHGKILGLELPFLHKLVDVITENYSDQYPELSEKKDHIINIIKKEEERFKQTIEKGELLLDQIISEAKSAKKSEISGEEAFKLYDTYGFPLELTVEIALEQDLKVNIEAFNAEMAEQKERARKAQEIVRLTDDLVFAEILNELGPTVFLGYCTTQSDNCKISAIIKDNEKVESAESEDLIDLVLDQTPFYGESGGQAGDAGKLSSKDFEAQVINTIRFGELFIHRVKVISGSIKLGKMAIANVDSSRRKDIVIHHSSAHLLQSALKKVLGEAVTQAGSQITPDRARFDFTFDRALTKDEISKVENLLNCWINENIEREIIETTIEQAKEIGAIALFNEKYGDKVRIVSIGEVSKELCGGTHVNSTGEIRLCKVVSEGAIASGIRRIELICGKYALAYLNKYESELEKISQTLKTPALESSARLDKMLEENKNLQKKLKNLESEVAQVKVESLFNEAKDIQDGKLLAARVDGLNNEVLKNSVDKLADKLGNSIILLASVINEGKISILCKVSDNFVKKGINAGQLINDIASKCEGRGGGKPNFAQAGAKNPENLDSAIDEIVKKLS